MRKIDDIPMPGDQIAAAMTRWKIRVEARESYFVEDGWRGEPGDVIATSKALVVLKRHDGSEHCIIGNVGCEITPPDSVTYPVTDEERQSTHARVLAASVVESLERKLRDAEDDTESIRCNLLEARCMLREIVNKTGGSDV